MFQCTHMHAHRHAHTHTHTHTHAHARTHTHTQTHTHTHTRMHTHARTRTHTHTHTHKVLCFTREYTHYWWWCSYHWQQLPWQPSKPLTKEVTLLHCRPCASQPASQPRSEIVQFMSARDGGIRYHGSSRGPCTTTKAMMSRQILEQITAE